MKPAKDGTSSIVTNLSTLSADTHHAAGSRPSRAVWAGRIVFLLFLVSVATALGVLTWYFLTGAEKELAEAQFESIADRALNGAYEIAIRKRLGTISMASVVAQMRPDADIWPFITIPGFETISNNLVATSSGRDMGLAPLVTPEQLADFEDFIYDFYENKRDPPFPNGTATSSFGKGVWGIDPSFGTSDKRYHETDGTTSYDSPHKIFAPVIHHPAGAHPILLFNAHFQKTRGEALDTIIDCSVMRAESDDPDSFICGVVTDMLPLVEAGNKPGPGALIFQPIYPAGNKTVLTGFLMSTIVWDEVLQNVFTTTVSGVDCVLETENQVYTYHVTNGVANLKGEGDLHDGRYDEFQRSIKLSGKDYYSDASALYTLSLYPTDCLYEVYSTINPTVSTIGAVCIIIFTSFLFILYDFCVRREFSTKDDLLDSKRRFVRFVSHEVRTPLNSVCMGLTLMQDEIAVSLGYKSSDDLLERTENNDQLEKLLSKEKQKALLWLTLVQDVQSNAQSSIDVLNDLLNYDKVETGTLRLELTTISMWNLIEKTTNEFLLPAKKKKIDFELIFTDLEEKDTKLNALRREVRNCRVVGDAVRLTQVLRNLVSNALKFTPEGGKLIVQASWVEESSSKKDKSKEKLFVLKNGEELLVKPSGHIQIQVQDTGAGMSEIQLSQLFSHGVQFNVNDLQAGQGSGLGLFIAKGIVEQHEGRLWADSEGIGLGTTFTVSLPMYHVPGLDGSYTSRDESTHFGDSSSRSECLRILVVDDVSSNRKLLSRLLTNRGHYSDTAEDGAVALAMVKQAIADKQPYDTILLDYEMPVMNGPTAATELRAMGCDVFIVGVTGNMLAEDVAYFRSCGANAVLGKPIKIASLDEIWSEYGITGQSTSEGIEAV